MTDEALLEAALEERYGALVAERDALQARIERLEGALTETTQALADIDLWLGQPMMDGSHVPKSRELAIKAKRVGRAALSAPSGSTEERPVR